jgi:hypothetical protein
VPFSSDLFIATETHLVATSTCVSENNTETMLQEESGNQVWTLDLKLKVWSQLDLQNSIPRSVNVVLFEGAYTAMRFSPGDLLLF